MFVPKYGIEGPVYLTSKDANKGQDSHSSHMQASRTGSSGTTADSAQDEFTLDEDKQMVTSKDGRRSYTVFDKAAVKISVEETFGHRRHCTSSRPCMWPAIHDHLGCRLSQCFRRRFSVNLYTAM